MRTQLIDTANAVDQEYLSNTYFNIVNGRPVLARLTKKPDPKGFQVVEDALTQKLQALDLSMLDVLGDTMRWLNWGKFFGPLSGHESKLEDEERRQILTTFAYGTGLGPTQVAKSVSGVSDRQIAFVNQRHVTTEKLEATICEVINAYIASGYPSFGEMQSVLVRTAPSGISTRTIFCRSTTSVTVVGVGSLTTMSVTLTLPCFPILSLAAFGRRSIFLTG